MLNIATQEMRMKLSIKEISNICGREGARRVLINLTSTGSTEEHMVCVYSEEGCQRI
jgi:hypothetical protein